MENIIQTKQCTSCWSSFNITDKDMEFYDKMSPIFAGEKYQMPTPKLCPDCRMQRRMAFRNERKLYRRKCDITGKDIISIYNPEYWYKVCDRHHWWSDDFDSTIYGKEVNLLESFFQQFNNLWKEVPNVALYNTNTVNTEYANHCLDEKNCYMISAWMGNEDCMYGNGMWYSKSSMDLLRGISCESCYECINCINCYKLFWSHKCKDCSESYFLYNCNNCNNCIWCINQNNKSYCIDNIQYSKEEYESKKAEIDIQSYTGIQSYKSAFHQKVKNSIHKYANLINCENVVWDSVEAAKNCHYCFDSKEMSDCKYITHWWFWMIDSYDWYGIWLDSSLMYDVVDTGIRETKVAFTVVVYESSNVYYWINCHGCHNLFWCIGLKNKEYCILNKQYSKEEYEQLVPKIIKKMESDWERGEFFHPQMSPFGYNETIAYEHFKLDKENVIKKGFKRSDYEAPFPQVDKILKKDDLPETINEIKDDILQQAIVCEITWRPFRIVRKELEFYNNHNLPLPRRHPDQRHLDRMSLSNPKKLRDRKCMKCWIDTKSSYSPDRPEKIYCESCYNKEIYW